MPTDRGARDDLIRILLPRVRAIANRHIRCAKFRATMADDIYSAGLLGLVRGVDRYDPQHGEPKPYVERCIDGGIRDYLRSQDHLTRDYRAHAKATGVEAWSAPVSLDAASMRSISLDRDPFPLIEILSDDRAESPETAAARRDRIAALERAARQLPPRTQDILRLHYSDALDMQVIGDRFGLSEARICQLVHEAHARIREALGVASAVSRPRSKRASRSRRLPGDDRAPRRAPRECSVCGQLGHRADNQRHRTDARRMA